MNLLPSLYWREPLWLLLAFLPLLAGVVHRLLRRSAWRRLADDSLLPWVQARSGERNTGRTKWLPGLSWALLCVALAGPRTPAWIPPALQPGDVSMVAVIDYSASMRVADGRPDRIGSAVALLRHLVDNAPPRLKTGLVIYAGHAHRILVPTGDRQLLRHYLAQLPSLQPPTLGNNLAAALTQAANMLQDDQQPGHLVIFTDGDLDPDAIADAERAVSDIAAAGNISLHWIGMGSAEHGTVPRPSGAPLVIDGRRITSRRHSGRIQGLATLSNGSYQTAGQLQGSLMNQLIEIPSVRIDENANDEVLWNEYFSIPVLAAALLLMFGSHRGQETTRRSLFALLAGLVLGGCQSTTNTPLPASIAESLAKGNYALARELSTRTPGYPARYAEGIACYRLTKYACAIRAFERAAWYAPNALTRGYAAFNLGLAHFRQGNYEQASVLFRDAELHGVDVAHTGINRAFADSLAEGVRRRLADIAETERRADWRSAAGQPPEGFEDRVGEGISLSRSDKGVRDLRGLSRKDLAALLEKGIRFATTRQGTGRPVAHGAWVKSPQKGQPLDTAGLMNALMTVETGLPVQPDEPLPIQGQRPW